VHDEEVCVGKDVPMLVPLIEPPEAVGDLAVVPTTGACDDVAAHCGRCP
jgi:hypothetical protein